MAILLREEFLGLAHGGMTGGHLDDVVVQLLYRRVPAGPHGLATWTHSLGDVNLVRHTVEALFLVEQS